MGGGKGARPVLWCRLNRHRGGAGAVRGFGGRPRARCAARRCMRRARAARCWSRAWASGSRRPRLPPPSHPKPSLPRACRRRGREAAAGAALAPVGSAIPPQTGRGQGQNPAPRRGGPRAPSTPGPCHEAHGRAPPPMGRRGRPAAQAARTGGAAERARRAPLPASRAARRPPRRRGARLFRCAAGTGALLDRRSFIEDPSRAPRPAPRPLPGPAPPCSAAAAPIPGLKAKGA
jgi:hypothetical protein